MCWFYMGVAKIALGPPPSVKRASPYTPRQHRKKCTKPSWQAFTPVPLQALPLWKQHISKRGFPYQSFTNTYEMKIWIAFRCQEEKKTL